MQDNADKHYLKSRAKWRDEVKLLAQAVAGLLAGYAIIYVILAVHV